MGLDFDSVYAFRLQVVVMLSQSVILRPVIVIYVAIGLD